MISKAIVAVCLVVAVFSFVDPCFAQSFRSYSSGNLLYGDFDNDSDPIYVWANEGYRLYSTLSNLSSNSDRFISNVNNGVYLFGMSGNFGLPKINDWQSRTMFYVQLADSREDDNSGLDTDFDGTIDLPGEGYMSGDRVQFFDVNADNIYDTRVNYTSTADNFDLLKSRDWTIVHSYRLADTKIGLSFSHLGYGNNYFESDRQSGLFDFVDPAHDFSYSNSLIQTDLSSLDILETRRESGDFKETYKTPANIIWLAYETPIGIIPQSELRFDIFLNFLENKYRINDKYDYFRDVSGGGITDIGSLSETAMVDSSSGGNIFTPKIRLIKHWSPRTYSWFDVGFGFGKFDADGSFSDNLTSETQLTDAGGNVEVTTRDYEDLSNQTGDTKRYDLILYHKTVVDFTERFTFSAGFDFLYMSDKTDWDAEYSTTDIQTFDDGDAVNDNDDYHYSQISSSAGNLISKNKTTIVNLPVALEYTLGRWTFRAGAVHQIYRQVVDEKFLVTRSSPTVTTYIYGNGDTSVTVSNDDYLSHGNSRDERSSSTNFVYGLQLKASDHLKVELIQFMETGGTDFLNTNFFRQLRLSMTVLF